MFSVVPPFSFIDRTTSVVKCSLSVPLTLNKIPYVVIALEILGHIRSPQEPDVCALSMLPEKRTHVIHNKNINLVYVSRRVKSCPGISTMSDIIKEL